MPITDIGFMRSDYDTPKFHGQERTKRRATKMRRGKPRCRQVRKLSEKQRCPKIVNESEKAWEFGQFVGERGIGHRNCSGRLTTR